MTRSIAKIGVAISCALWAQLSLTQVLQFGNNEDRAIYGNEITEFTWMRGQYTNHRGGQYGFRRGGWWDTDYPDSDENFLRGVMRYTNVYTNPRNHDYIQLTDPRLFEHIFLYMNWKRVPIGSSYSGPNFSPEEIEALREFMFRGGFVMVDDFWGQPHLDDMFMEIQKILHIILEICVFSLQVNICMLMNTRHMHNLY